MLAQLLHISTCVNAMSNKSTKIRIKLPKKRNPLVIDARQRRAGPMKDRRTPRGGSKNKLKEFEEEYDEEDYE